MSNERCFVPKAEIDEDHRVISLTQQQLSHLEVCNLATYNDGVVSMCLKQAMFSLLKCQNRPKNGETHPHALLH